MSFILIKNADNTIKYLIEGYIEAENELNALSTDFTPGSKVKAIDTGKTYILTESKEWKYLPELSGKVDALEDEIRTLAKLKNWLGETTTAIVAGSTVNPILIDGASVTASAGDVAAYDNGTTKDEFIFSEAGTWQVYDDMLDVYTKDETDILLEDKVDKIPGKGLSTNDFTTEEKTKLTEIAAGAEVNVQSDWTQSNTTADDFIKNKPTLGTAASKNSTNAVTEGSTDLIESGAVKTAIDNAIAAITDYESEVFPNG